MSRTNEDKCFVAIAEKGSLRCRILSGDSAVTVAATISEDPTIWQEVQLYWPRYRTPVVEESLENEPFESTSAETLPKLLAANRQWMFIDFDSKTIATSPKMKLGGTSRVFDLFSSNEPQKRWPLSIHLPPWWELRDAVSVEQAMAARSERPSVQQTDREILYGKPMLEFIAHRVLQVGNAPQSRGFLKSNLRQLHSSTIEIHRDWLMLPREDLQGKHPRQLLHGAHDWINRVTHGQILRALSGLPLIAAPKDVINYERSPLGLEEVVVYFNLCRELIEYGWLWLKRIVESGQSLNDRNIEELIAELEQAKSEWLMAAFEGGSSANFIIECSRRRVPRSPETPIEGIIEQETNDHIVDCNCPICVMIADGAFGPSFNSLDGMDLESDEEFAFSQFETLTQWRQEQQLLGSDDFSGCDEDDFDEEIDETSDDDDDEAEDAKPESDGPFESAWRGVDSLGRLPGDGNGHIKLAFMMAEIVSVLESQQVEQEIISDLNQVFRLFRLADNGEDCSKSSELHRLRGDLVVRLESIANLVPQLIPRIADFQSQLEELRMNTIS